MRFLAFLSTLLLSQYLFADLKQFSIDTKRITVIITTASYCAPCHVLERALKSTNSYESIKIPIGSNALTIPLKHLSPETDEKILSQWGITDTTTPVLYVFLDKKIVMQSLFQDLSTNGVIKLITEAFERVATMDVAIDDIQSFTNRISMRLKSATQITFIGTGRGPEQSPIFVGYSIKEIQKSLAESFNVGNDSEIVLGGSGYKSQSADFIRRSYVLDSSGKPINYKMEPTKLPNFSSDYSFTPESFQAAMNISRANGTKRNIVVSVGHGSTDGLETWGGEKKYKPEAIGAAITSSGVPTIVVTGNCYGGVLASYVACGFFGARPDKQASGCWESEDSKVKDYATGFFNALAKSISSNSKTLNDVHFDAAMAGAEGDVPFTVVDQVADTFFKAHPEKLPETIIPSEISQLPLTDAETKALKFYVGEVDSKAVINLKKKSVSMQIGIPRNADGSGGLGEWISAKSSVQLDNEPFESPLILSATDQEKLFSKRFLTMNSYKKSGQFIKMKGLVLSRTVGSAQIAICAQYLAQVGPKESGPSNSSECEAWGFEVERNRLSNPMPLQILRRGLLRKTLATAPRAGQFTKWLKTAESCEQTKVSDFIQR